MTKKDDRLVKSKDTSFWEVRPSARVDFTTDLSKADDKPPFRYLEEDGEGYLVEKDIIKKTAAESLASIVSASMSDDFERIKETVGIATKGSHFASYIPSKRKIPEITTSTKSGMRSEVSSNAGDLFIKTLAMSPQDRERFLKMVLNNSFLRKQIDEMIEEEKSVVVVEEMRLEDEDYSDRDVVVSEEPREIKEEKPKSFGEWGA